MNSSGKFSFFGQELRLKLGEPYVCQIIEIYDLSIGSTETKYIKLNTKTQNIFCCLNETLKTFLYTLTRGTRKQKEKKRISLLKCIQKLNVILKNLGFSI